MRSYEKLHEIARDLHWVVSHTELAEAGFGRAAIRHALDTQRLFGRYPGVFVVGRRELTDRGAWRAATLACGDDAVLSHLPAGRLWDVYEDVVYRLDVSVPTQDGREAPEDITLHRAETLLPGQVVLRDKIAVTDLRRTLIDVAGILPPRGLRSVLRRAEQVHGLSLDELYRSVEEPRRVAKYARLRRALEEWVPETDLTESDLEQEFLRFCDRHRLPLPEPQVWFLNRTVRADFVWEDLKLIVETDSRRYHTGAIAGQIDGSRDRRLRAIGYEVQRFTWAEIINRPGPTAGELRAIIKRRRLELQSS